MKRLTTTTTSACILASTFLSHAQPGSLDMTFNPGSGANAAIACMALETNGQIVIGGNFTSFNGASQNYVARLNADGSLDTTFYPGVGPSGAVQAVAVQSNGEILIAGGFGT